jgi:amidohydrolase
MTKTELMRSVNAAIDKRASEIIGLGETIRRHPELGFKEFKTARLVEDTMRGMGLSPKGGLAITGVRADAAGRGGDGPTFALLGELDGLIVPGHPFADPETGAAHACGHNAQVAGLLGAAMGLLDAKAFDHLAGRVAFIAVPAEEYGDVAWRVAQRNEGKLEFLGGKPEMLRLGHLDDVDMAMMIHATPRTEEGKLAVPISNNGCTVKTVRYIGKAAHAGGMPHRGINALYAANIALSAINAIRETFRDEDTIRVHPIITRGGSQVNVIPADVRLEMYVRGKSIQAIADADRKVDRALRAGALALGAKVEIETLPGYMPMHCDATLVERFPRRRRRAGRGGQRRHDRAPHRLDGHGGSRAGHAHHPSVCGRRVRHLARRRLRDHRPEPDLHHQCQGARLHGGGPPRRRRQRGARGAVPLQAADDEGGLPRVPARDEPRGALRGLGP